MTLGFLNDDSAKPDGDTWNDYAADQVEISESHFSSSSPPHPFLHPSPCCSSYSAEHYYTTMLFLFPSRCLRCFIHLSSHPQTFSELHPFQAVATCWETSVKSDEAPFQQWHLINWNLISGMSREEVVFFHELLYNRITQPEGQMPHHWGLRRLRWSSLKMNSEYSHCWLTGCAWL